MKSFIRIIVFAIFINIHFHAYPQEGVCENKIAEIKEISKKLVRDHIELTGINENEKQEIKDLSDVLYNYVEEITICTVLAFTGTQTPLKKIKENHYMVLGRYYTIYIHTFIKITYIRYKIYRNGCMLLC